MNAEAMITLKLIDESDRDFLAIVQLILNNSLRHYRPEGVYVVLIDNWFDHKWLEFNSSREVDSLGWRPKLRLPSFEPSRVLNQSYFRAATVSPLRYEPSKSNTLHILSSRRSVGEISSSGVFLWYSKVDEHSDRGSLMIYLSEEGKGSAWYASFRKNPDWCVGKVKGISRREFSDLMAISDVALPPR